jgi:TniQ protein
MSSLLPCHPHRLDNEILSSWMLRVASDNVVSVRRLFAWLGGEDRRVRSLDGIEFYNPLIKSIAEAFGAEQESIIQCLPAGLYGLFGKSIPYWEWGWRDFTEWRLLEGRLSLNLGNQYCLTCLRQSGHHQLSWTIAVYSCCLQHKCFLRERCPHCGKAFRGASRLFGSLIANPQRDLLRCAYCGRSVVNHEFPELVDEKIVKLTHVLDSLVRKPRCIDYFAALARLLHVMCLPSTVGKHIRSQMLPGSHQFTSRRSGGALYDFEYLDVKARAVMLQAAVSLFADWPDYLIAVLRSKDYPKYLHHLLRYPSLPAWYESAVRIAATKDGKPSRSIR